MLYAYGNNEEHLAHTMESLTSLPVVEAARREYPGQRVCIGVVESIDPAMYIDADDITDMMLFTGWYHPSRYNLFEKQFSQLGVIL